MNFRKSDMLYMNPYDIHKALINEYILRRPGDTKHLKRDCSNDRTDIDVLRDNHKFLWDDEVPATWESHFAKKYYDKLFKEYCISDLSRYKENKVALRWRTEQEVVTGKGQFICACKTCLNKDDLRTWEVNFAYHEDNKKKNVLVKIRLCPGCSKKLNYHSKKREIKRIKYNKLVGNQNSEKTTDYKDDISAEDSHTIQVEQEENEAKETPSICDKPSTNESPWENLKPVESKTRDEEMEEYLQELLL